MKRNMMFMESRYTRWKVDTKSIENIKKCALKIRDQPGYLVTIYGLFLEDASADDLRWFIKNVLNNNLRLYVVRRIIEWVRRR